MCETMSAHASAQAGSHWLGTCSQRTGFYAGSMSRLAANEESKHVHLQRVFICAHLHSPVQDPNPEDPLNKEAAQLFQDNPRQFQTYVQVSFKERKCLLDQLIGY